MKTLLPLLFALGAFAAEGSLDRHLSQGQLLESQGRYEDAAREFEAALPEAERLGPADVRLPLTLHNLGAVYRALGRYPEAERSYRRAIAIFEAGRPRWNAELAATLDNLGALNLALGRPSRAEPLYRHACQLEGNARSVSLQGLAQAAHQLHRYVDAEELYRRATALAESPLAAADISHNLALLYRDLRRDADARPLLERAASAYETAAPRHPKLAVIQRNLAELEAAAGNPSRAGSLFERSLAICDESLPPDHPQTGIILQAYAQFLSRTGRKKDARAAAERSRAILAHAQAETGAAYTVDLSAFARK